MVPSETGSTCGLGAGAAFLAAFQEREAVGIEQFAAPPRHPVGMASVDEPEDGKELAPAAAALVHRVGVQRLVDQQARVERLDRIAVLPELLQARDRSRTAGDRDPRRRAGRRAASGRSAGLRRDDAHRCSASASIRSGAARCRPRSSS